MDPSLNDPLIAVFLVSVLSLACLVILGLRLSRIKTLSQVRYSVTHYPSSLYVWHPLTAHCALALSSHVMSRISCLLVYHRKEPDKSAVQIFSIIMKIFYSSECFSLSASLFQYFY